MTDHHRFQLSSWGWARVSEVFQFQAKELHGAGWGIKGHNRPWLIENGEWKPGLRFLDVGAGYSDLPAHLVKEFKMEGWVADDYGMAAGEEVWSRWGNPRDLPSKYPQVKYVFLPLGTPEAWNTFPTAYFDRIYSVSALEHVPRENMGEVFRHMVSLLKPGGIMLHSVDITTEVPLENYLPHNIAQKILIRGMANWCWDVFGHWWFVRNSIGKPYYPGSAAGWAHFIRKNLNIVSGKDQFRLTPSYSVMLDSDILVEPIDVVYKFHPPSNRPKKFGKTCSLVFILKSLLK